MKEGKSAVKNSPGKENEPDTENTTKKKTKEEKPPLKVVVRRLPPSMTEEQFKMQVSPMPDYDYFYFVQADMTLMPNAFTRAYINFVDQNDLFIFTEKFDGYVFIDSKGFEFPAVVEFAPFQRIPKNRPSRKKDSKVGTIESDPTYIAFKELLEAENLENKTAANVSKQHFFETALAQEKKDEVSNTPLLDYIKNKRAERQRIRDEKREEKRKKDLERRKAKEEQRKVKKDDETSVVKNPSPTPANPIPKTKEVSLDNMEKRGNLSNNKLEKKISSNETIFITHTTALSKVKNEEKVSKKVTELIDFFHETINEMNKNKCRPKDMMVDSALPNFRKHEDLEKAILKGGEREVTLKPDLPQAPSHSKFNFQKIMNYSSEESSVSGPTNPVSGGRLLMCVPYNKRKVMFSRSHSDIVMRPIRVNARDGMEGQPDIQNFVKECEIIRPVRPIRVNIPVIPGNKRSCDLYNQTSGKSFDVRSLVKGNVTASQSKSDINENVHFNQKVRDDTEDTKVINDQTNVPKSTDESVNNCESKKSDGKSEALKKNLQKVVADVLGNTKVSSPKENIINKPKTFVRRYSGIGDECHGQGYNTPNFYLPPRAFGFGIVDSKNTSNRNRSNTSRPFTPSSGRPPFSKKSLPPFSKKPVYFSKSDGSIEKPETHAKAGGSEENFLRVPPQAFIIKRPFGAPGVSKVVGKNG